jgi:hypothetical protein
MIVKRPAPWRSGPYKWSFDAMPVYNSEGPILHIPIDSARAMPVYRCCVKCPAFRTDDGAGQMDLCQVKWSGALFLDVKGCEQMAPPFNVDVVRVTIFGQRDTRQVLNTFHVSNPGGWTLGTMAALANDTVNWINTIYKTLVPSVYSWYLVSVRLYNPSNPLAYDQSISPPIVGTRAGTAEAGSVTSTLSLRTGLAGRRYRGRMYVAGISETDVATNDLLGSGYVALAGTVAQAFLTAINTGGRNATIFHKLSNTYTNVNGYAIENIVDNQRRRLPGRGR